MFNNIRIALGVCGVIILAVIGILAVQGVVDLYLGIFAVVIGLLCVAVVLPSRRRRR